MKNKNYNLKTWVQFFSGQYHMYGPTDDFDSSLCKLPWETPHQELFTAICVFQFTIRSNSYEKNG